MQLQRVGGGDAPGVVIGDSGRLLVVVVTVVVVVVVVVILC